MLPAEMRALLPWLRRGLHAAALAFPLAATTGCMGSSQTVPKVEGAFTPVDVSDAQYATVLSRVLRDGAPTPERLALLAGVVRRQLAHAAPRFNHGHDAHATDGVLGALYLIRAGEGRKEMVDASGEKALAGAVERFSSRGDEGRAESLMRMRAAALDPSSPARALVEEHLKALLDWKQETRTGGALHQLGADERATVGRALVEPSDESLVAAVKALNNWIARAIEYKIAFQEAHQGPERDEVQRALESGGVIMAVLFLRNGDARGALQVLEQTGAERVMLPALFARIRSAAVNDTPRDWLALASVFASGNQDEDGDSDIDPQLLSAALWGTALETYRRDPQGFDGALLLSRSLIHFGMPEGVPLVLEGALGARATPETVSASLDLILAAVDDSAGLDDFDSARRTFKAAAGVLAQAERPELKGRIEPTPARVRSVMAGIELRSGNLADARPLLEQAAAEEPSASAFTTLALVERQAGNGSAAVADVTRALAAPDARAAFLDVGDANLLAFEVKRDSGDAEAAKASLDAALNAALAARQAKGNAAVRARAERLLGRVLQGYGDAKGATRAFERALSAAASDRPTLAATMLDAVGRALVRKDLPAARAALKRGIEGDVSEEDLVYGGLWVSLLEREAKAPSDGTVERALRAGSKTAWTTKLSAWAGGKLSDAELGAAAQSPSQRVEAAFYTAMAGKVKGDPGAEQRLKQVAGAPVIDLLEVQLARDLTAPRVQADLPGGVQLP